MCLYRRPATENAAKAIIATVQTVEPHQQGSLAPDLVMSILGKKAILIGHRHQIARVQAEDRLRHHLRQRRIELPAIETKQPLALDEEKTLG
ncbi:hypothetical protein D3C71_2091370 [compost metagenome]